MRIVVRKVVCDAAYGRVHLAAAERLLVNLLACSIELAFIRRVD